jgi:replicative DNA helicase
MATENRLQPHDLDSEMAVLGCAILDSSCVGKILTETRSSRSAFFDVRNQVIYDAILGMSKAGTSIDLITIQTYLRDRKNMDMAGGRGYVSSLIDHVASSAMVGTYLACVVDKWRLRNALNSLNESIAEIYESRDSVNEVVDRIESRILQSTRVGSESSKSWVDGVGLARAAVSYFEKIFIARSTGKIPGIPTGYPDLDSKMLGLLGPEVTVIAARPSCGKTALAMNIAQNVAESGVGVAVFSLETNSELLGARSLSSMAQVNARENLRQEDLQKIAVYSSKLGSLPLYVKDDVYGIDEIRREARRICAEKSIGLIVLDYMQLIVGDDRKPRKEQVGQCSRGIKLMAKELGVPVIGLAQVSRELEGGDRVPKLSDLKESGDLEQDADNVIFLHRRRGKDDEPDDSGGNPFVVSLIIAKQKMGPRDIEVDLIFHPKHTRFTSCSRQQI